MGVETCCQIIDVPCSSFILQTPTQTTNSLQEKWVHRRTGRGHRSDMTYLEKADLYERAVAVGIISLLQKLYLQPDPKPEHIVLVGEAAGGMKGVGGLNWGRGERERARVETEREDSMTFVSVATQPRINMPRLARRTSGTSDSVIVKLSELRLKPSAKLIRAEKGAEDKTETRNWSK